ncbi:hypothetical protein CR513_54457, partial [Mucuna pruriens]
MTKDKVITLGPNELPNLVTSYHLDDRNYLQWAQYIRTTLKGRTKLSHIEGNNLPKDDPKICNGDKKKSHKRSTSEGKPFTKSSHGEYYTYCKRSGHTKDTSYKRYGKEKVLERMGGNKGSTQMWVNQTTSDKENVVEHPSTLQLYQYIQVFSKEEMDHIRALLNSTIKPLGSCGLTMNDKSSFNIFSSILQSIWILDSGATNYMTPLWSDNGTEFVNLEFSKFLKDNGVVHELTCVNTPQQNGVAERKSRHLLEVTRALLFQMSVLTVYWGEAVLTTTYLINKLPTRVLNGGDLSRSQSHVASQTGIKSLNLKLRSSQELSRPRRLCMANSRKRSRSSKSRTLSDQMKTDSKP